MPIGVGAAMLIGSAVAGGAAVGSAKIQSNAAKKAQEAQQKATDQALKVQQDTSAPYRQLGQQGIDRLTALGPPQPYTQQFRAPGPGPQSNGFQPFQPSGGPQGAPPTLGGIGMPPGPGGPQTPGMGEMVTLQAPDGSTRQFPAMDAQRVLAQARAAGHELRQV